MKNRNELDKKTISKNFSYASKNYDEFAAVQKMSAAKLCSLVLPLIQNNDSIIDLGSGTSAICKNLFSSQNFYEKNLEVFELDLSSEMLGIWSEKSKNHIHSIAADAENLPLKSDSFNIIISSFSLQWLQNFEEIFADFKRILKKDGILAFCLPTNSSLKELKISSIESGCNFNFINLPEMEILKSALLKSGFREIEMQSEVLKSEFNDGIEALKSLKKIGANYSAKKKLISRKPLNHFNNLCLEKFSTSNKKLAISWEVTYFLFSNS